MYGYFGKTRVGLLWNPPHPSLSLLLRSRGSSLPFAPLSFRICALGYPSIPSSKTKKRLWRSFVFVGLPGIEPGLHAPHACVLPVYYSPRREEDARDASVFAYSPISSPLTIPVYIEFSACETKIPPGRGGISYFALLRVLRHFTQTIERFPWTRRLVHWRFAFFLE